MIKLNNQKILSALATSLFLVSFSPTIAQDYNETKTAQTTLKNLGYSVGSVDGILGAKTLDAIIKFCQTEKPKCNPNNIEEVLALLNKPSEITQNKKKSLISETKLELNTNAFQESSYIKGINDAQWKTISDIGDPQNCRTRIKSLEGVSGKLITASEFARNPSVIANRLQTNKTVILSDGIFKLDRSIRLNGNNLIGSRNTVLDATGLDFAIYAKSSVVKNLRVKNANNVGITIYNDVTVHNVIVENTGVGALDNSRGHGFSIQDKTSINNCLVSVEAFNGFNNKGSGETTRNGGNADGFEIKYGANSVTLIDAHGHNNSDDGIDLWKMGDGTNFKTDDVIIRIYYSSANLNGKNPLTANGDGNGFKMGSRDKYQAPKQDKGARLIYGSAACYNFANGFDRNGTKMKVFSSKLSAAGNGYEQYRDFDRYFSSDRDPYVLKCNMFPRK